MYSYQTLLCTSDTCELLELMLQEGYMSSVMAAAKQDWGHCGKWTGHNKEHQTQPKTQGTACFLQGHSGITLHLSTSVSYGLAMLTCSGDSL